MVTTPAVPPYSSTTTAIVMPRRWRLARTSSSGHDSGTASARRTMS